MFNFRNIADIIENKFKKGDICGKIENIDINNYAKGPRKTITIADATGVINMPLWDDKDKYYGPQIQTGKIIIVYNAEITTYHNTVQINKFDLLIFNIKLIPPSWLKKIKSLDVTEMMLLKIVT